MHWQHLMKANSDEAVVNNFFQNDYTIQFQNRQNNKHAGKRQLPVNKFITKFVGC